MFRSKLFYFIYFLLIQFFPLAQNYSIILGRPTQNSITLSLLFDQNSEFYIDYGIESGAYKNKTSIASVSANVPLEYNLSGLAKSTRYYYKLFYRKIGQVTYISSPEYQFITQRETNSSFVFTVEADEHLYDKKGVDNLYKICLANQLSDKPDFMISLGDTFGDDHNPTTITSQELKTLHYNYRPFLGTICHSVPFYFCLGNHEGENNYYIKQNPPNNLTIQATLWRKYYYPNPFPNDFYSGNSEVEGFDVGNPENYYSWQWGDALFVVLDAYRYQSVEGTSEKPKSWDWTLGKKQYDWMRSTLEKSQAKYKFVFAHHIRGQDRGALTNAKLYEWGGNEGDGKTYSFDKNRPGWGKPIHQVFKDTGVNIFFQGHDHLFAKEDLDNVVYQEVPMASDSTYEIGMLANADAYTANQRNGSGHIRVSVNPENIKVDFVRAYLPADTKSGQKQNKEIGFTYTIGKNSNPLVLGTEPSNKIALKVIPNPVDEKCIIDLSGTYKDVTFRLYNLNGNLILETKSYQFSTQNFPEGIYILTANVDEELYHQKILIKH